MSGFGFSPTDVIQGVAAGKKAAAALRSNEHGAQQQYQQSKRALAYRVRALEDLSATAAKVFPEAKEQSQPLLDVDRSFQQGLGLYEGAIGRGANPGAHHGIVRKLRFAFGGQKDVQAHLDASKPAVDAAIFRSLQVQIELVKRHHEQSSEKLNGIVVDLGERLDSIRAACAPKEPSQLTDLDDRDSDNSLLEPIGTRRPVRSADEFAMVYKATGKKLNSRKVVVPRHNPNRKPRYDRIRKVAKAKQLAENGPFTSSGIDCALPQTTPLALLKTDDEAEDASQFLSNVLCALCAITVTASYQEPNTHRLFASMIQASRKDPVFAALFGWTIVVLARCLMQVPRQILLLSDDSISLETALGEPLKVPACYWRAHEIFHGYLEAHFNDRPGRNLVVRKSYRILLGGMEGQAIDASKWTKTVARRMQLVMAMVLDDYEGSCPKCKDPLGEETNSRRYCSRCDKFYASIEGEEQATLQTADAPPTVHATPSVGEDYDGLVWEKAIDIYNRQRKKTRDASALYVNVMLRLSRTAMPPRSYVGYNFPTENLDNDSLHDTDSGSTVSDYGYDLSEDIYVHNGDNKFFMRAFLDTGMMVNAINSEKAKQSGLVPSEYTGPPLEGVDGLEIPVLGQVDLLFHFKSYRSAKSWTIQCVVLHNPDFDVALGEDFIHWAGLLTSRSGDTLHDVESLQVSKGVPESETPPLVATIPNFNEEDTPPPPGHDERVVMGT